MTAIRTFVCVELPPSEADRIAELQGRLRAHGARVSWVAPANVHVTLAFLGDVDEGRIPDVVAAVGRAAGRAAPFGARIDGVGAFPKDRRPRVFWAGLGGEVVALATLRHAVVDELALVGFPPDAKPFAAHVTIGRVKNDRDPALRAVSDALAASGLVGDPFEVREVVVMRSDLDPRGARYTPLARLRLGAESAGRSEPTRGS